MKTEKNKIQAHSASSKSASVSDMTVGSPLRQICKFALPLILGYILQEVLCRQGFDRQEAQRLAAVADGSAARAMALREPEVRELHQKAFQLAERAGRLPVEEMLQLAKDMSGYSREQLIQWLGFLAMLYRDLLVLYSGGGLPLYNQPDVQRLSALLARYPQHSLLALLRLVQEYQKRLRSNVNLQLSLEGFLIKLEDLMQ